MDKTSGAILVVDDDTDILTAGRLLLSRHFELVETCRRPENVPGMLERFEFDAVLLDMNFGPGESSGRQGLEWLQRILAIDPQLSVVMITAHGGVDTVVDAMKLGATDFVAKPWQNEKVVATLSAAVALHRSRVESDTLKKTNAVLSAAASGPPADIIFESAAMHEVLSLVDRAAPSDANVLILGENGTGKELVARELHRRSTRADKVLLGVDLGSISENLFESELFGHRKGAFTDAIDDRLGRFQAASGGTLLLDEIGNIPMHLQAKLLRALEQRAVTPVGADRSEAVDVRVVSATNVPPERLRDPGVFRPDLLFRLNTVEITVPPLRERPDDVLPIARHFLALYTKRYGGSEKSLTPQAESVLRDYHWPGNVRALRHAVERAVILAPGRDLQPADFQLADPAPVVRTHTNTTASLNLDAVEKQTITEALHKHGFNISRAAKELGLTRASLYRRMEKHGL
ncbi:MAG: sigma-54 dependent transcriptional regulator [Woeseiaceae bacterium]|nr:sigma-54 dependent transcriptional regulator [Woeseiaceae bacterium]